MTVTPLKQVTPPKGKGNRYYETPEGARYPSVTSILSVIAKPALIEWSASEARKEAIEGSADLYADLPLDKPRMARLAYIDTLTKRLGKVKAHNKLMQQASDIGSAAHARVDYEIQRQLGKLVGLEPPMMAESLLAFAAWEDWWQQAKLTPVWTEQKVYSSKFEYAGTADLLARSDDDGAFVLVDFKTSKAIYPEAFLQLAAYAKALDEMGHGPVGRALVVRLPKTEHDPGFEVQAVGDIDQTFDDFLHVRRVWEWQQFWERQRELKHQLKVTATAEAAIRRGGVQGQ